MIPSMMQFVSPTHGKLEFYEMFHHLVSFVEEDVTKTYHLIIGTDSIGGDEATFVTAIVIHRVGNGGKYFYRKIRVPKTKSLPQRIYQEASLSLEVASLMRAELSKNGYTKLPVEIHLDVGENGETKQIIREVVGMVNGSGYDAVVKPAAYGASKVADRHSK